MPSMQSLHDVFVHELRDLYSAERQLVKALPKMAKNAGSPELAEALESHLRETEVQVTRIEEILDGLGERTGGVKCKGMEGLIEEGKEVLDMDGEEPALDAAMIGAAQRVEHYEIAAYGTAIAHAQAQGHRDAVRLLEATLEEEKNADKLLSQIAERGINALAVASADIDITNGGLASRSSKGNGTARRNGRSNRGLKNGSSRSGGRRGAKKA